MPWDFCLLKEVHLPSHWDSNKDDDPVAMPAASGLGKRSCSLGGLLTGTISATTLCSWQITFDVSCTKRLFVKRALFVPTYDTLWVNMVDSVLQNMDQGILASLSSLQGKRLQWTCFFSGSALPFPTSQQRVELASRNRMSTSCRNLRSGGHQNLTQVPSWLNWCLTTVNAFAHSISFDQE